MNNGATTTSSVWHDPAIIRQMEGAPSQNMMELLRERTEQQVRTYLCACLNSLFVCIKI